MVEHNVLGRMRSWRSDETVRERHPRFRLVKANPYGILMVMTFTHVEGSISAVISADDFHDCLGRGHRQGQRGIQNEPWKGKEARVWSK
jgi:hypothetical protein